jgi:hypothetical protein
MLSHRQNPGDRPIAMYCSDRRAVTVATEATATITIERNVAVPMRDDVTLRADIYMKADSAPGPVLLQRTPYDRTRSMITARVLEPMLAIDAGFTVVIQDARGRFASEGTFEPFRQESDDGEDTVEWIASQDWCDGRVAMYGNSYSGATQLLTAIRAPSALAAIAPDRTSADYWQGWTYENGVLQLGFIVTWLLSSLGNADLERLRLVDPALASRLANAFDELANRPDEAFMRPTARLADVLSDVSPYARSWFAHRQRDQYWRGVSASEHLVRVTVPALHVAGWHDIFLTATLATFRRLRASAATAWARRGQRLVIGPWTHQTTGSAAGALLYGLAAALPPADSTRLHLEFFAACLRGQDPPGSPVRLYVMGSDRWCDEDQWPPADVRATNWYLHHGGKLASAHCAPEPAVTDFIHDPANPTPTVAGTTLLPGDDISQTAGPHSRLLAQQHPGTVMWTSTPVAEDLELCGYVQAVLWVSADATDADVYVALSAVDRAGEAMHVGDGIQRLSFRNGGGSSTPLAAEDIVCVNIAMGATSILLAAGTRIRVEVAGSCFPRFEQHPDHRRQVRQHIHHGAVRPSHLRLQVR